MDIRVDQHIPYSQMSPEQKAQKRHDATQTAAGVGAAGVTAQVGSRYVTAKKGSVGLLRKMYADMINATKTVSKDKEVATGVWATFVHNTKRFSADIMKRLMKLENNKILGPIIKSPLAKKVSGFFGAATAFFVLITGLSDAAKNGKIAMSDIKEKFNIAA